METIPRNNTVIVKFPELVDKAIEADKHGNTDRGNGVAVNADVALLEAHLAVMRNPIDKARAERTIRQIRAGKRRYNFEIPPIAQTAR